MIYEEISRLLDSLIVGIYYRHIYFKRSPSTLLLALVYLHLDSTHRYFSSTLMVQIFFCTVFKSIDGVSSIKIRHTVRGYSYDLIA